MSFFGIMGVGMAMNLIQGLFKPKPPMVNSSYFSSLTQTLANNSQEMAKMWEKPPEVKTFAFDFKTPDFPEQAATKLVMQQQKNEGERSNLLTQLQSDKDQMKEEFFSKNHYETRKGADGREQVATQNGKPVIAKGPENQTQQNTRLGYEATQKAEMFTKHAGEKQAFVQEQKQELMAFLDSNKFQLSNPGIQGEMSKLIMDSKKKALKIQGQHEEEFYKIDLPIKEMHAKVDEKLAQYRELERTHLEKEENSPEAKELANYQQDLVALLDEKRAEARDRKKSEMFLKDPREWLKNPPKQDLASVLPMNMVAALEEFGITDIPA